MDFGTVLQTWQYYAGVIFLGGLLGTLLFRFTPLPAEVAGHIRTLVQAGAALDLAKRSDSDSMEMLAKQVGVHEIAAIMVSIRNQRHQMLTIGVIAAAVIVLLGFMFIAFMIDIPGWIYVIGALVGAFLVWRLW